MNQNSVALYCHVRASMSGKEADSQLTRQRQLLEQYAKEQGLVPSACYMHAGAAPEALVLARMLEGAARMKLDTILTEQLPQSSVFLEAAVTDAVTETGMGERLSPTISMRSIADGRELRYSPSLQFSDFICHRQG